MARALVVIFLLIGMGFLGLASLAFVIMNTSLPNGQHIAGTLIGCGWIVMAIATEYVFVRRR